MNNFELQTLIFKETDKVRTFFSNDFNFIYDKVKRYSICYGKSPKDTPSWDPLSPEVIEFIIDESFIFNKHLTNINNILNIHEEADKQLISISTVSNIILNINDIYLKNIDEIIKLYQYLDQFNFFIELKVNYNSVNSFGDVFRLKVFEIPNVLFDVYNFNISNFADILENCMSKYLNVSFYFNIDSKNYQNFIDLVKTGVFSNSATIFVNVSFNKQITKKQKNEFIQITDNKFNFTICDTKNVNNSKLNFNNIKPYQDGMFKCYVDFINYVIYPSMNEKANFVKFNEINNIDSYWNSHIFKDYRSQFVKSKYEED